MGLLIFLIGYFILFTLIFFNKHAIIETLDENSEELEINSEFVEDNFLIIAISLSLTSWVGIIYLIYCALTMDEY